MSPLRIGIGATMALALWAIQDPGGAAAGWLAGWMFMLGLALGALAWRAIHALTGGGWGHALRPVIDPWLGAMPILVLLFIPVLAALPWLYTWAADPAAALPGVAEHWLNRFGFAARGVGALLLWWGLATLLRRHPADRRIAAAALLLHALAISVVSVDWLLSLTPRFTSSAFAMGLVMVQMQGALALALLRGGGHGDLRGLLFATTLGVIYLTFMQYLVAWYGGLPDRLDWWQDRAALPWTALIQLALVLAGVVPVGTLLWLRGAWPRRIGAGVLAGQMAWMLWVVAPNFGWSGLVAGLLGLPAVGGLVLGLLERRPAPVVAHG